MGAYHYAPSEDHCDYTRTNIVPMDDSIWPIIGLISLVFLLAIFWPTQKTHRSTGERTGACVTSLQSTARHGGGLILQGKTITKERDVKKQ